jgi:hypothetical protein
MRERVTSPPEVPSITPAEVERRLATCYRIILDSARRAQGAADTDTLAGNASAADSGLEDHGCDQATPKTTKVQIREV